jgi:hypothetical protein
VTKAEKGWYGIRLMANPLSSICEEFVKSILLKEREIIVDMNQVD